MRKKGILLIFALAGLFSSCNDAIDIKQPGEVSEGSEVFRNTSDIARGISGVFASLPGESEIEFVSTFTDEVSIGLNNGGQGLISGEYGFFMQPGNSFAISTWGSYYSIINRVNRLLNSCDDLVASGAATNATINSLRAELYAIRAYSNYKLFAYFTPDYTNPSGLSIMKLNYVPDSENLSTVIGRSTVAEIKEFILEDLTKAETLRTGSWEGYNNVNGGMIQAVRVKLFAMTGDYTDLLTSANVILQNPDFKLSTASQYAGMFGVVQDANYVEPSSEIIFKLKRVLGNGGRVASAWYSSRVSNTGSFFYEMGRSLYNELDKLDPASQGMAFTAARSDVRYAVNLDPDTKVATNYQSLSQAAFVANDNLLIGKYQGKSGDLLQNDIPIFRTADIYLAMAEAMAAQGNLLSSSNDPDDMYNDLTSVQGILFTIRFNRATDASSVVIPNITNAQSAWKAILDERRVEFAFEGHRYLDMKRIGAKAGSNGFERYSKDCVVNAACNLPVNDFRMTLPIPTTELNSNPIIKNQQNPGY